MTLARSNMLLLLTAVIWGSSFIFQKMAMDTMDPFIYNALRFFLAALCLIPIRYIRRGNIDIMDSSDKKHMLIGSLLAGTVLYIAAAFQQIGLELTTVSNAGFITGLYILFVPLIGITLGHRYGKGIWVAILIACAGLYLVSGMTGFYLQKGDLFILISAFFWGSHLIIIDHVSNRHHPIVFAIRQFIVCGVLSMITAIALDERLLITDGIEWFYIFINGFLAIALGYTFQIVGQKITPPSQAALIFSTEAIFAALTGYFFLNEILGPMALLGCALMLGGSLMAQFYPPLDSDAKTRHVGRN